jgi:hypothetical protein
MHPPPGRLPRAIRGPTTATSALYAVLGIDLAALVPNQVVAIAAGLLWMRVEGLVVRRDLT